MFKRLKERKGAVTVMAAIVTVTILGFTALGVDIGMVATSRNQLQNAADSAALAAGSRLLVMNNAEIINIAKTYAGSNKVLNEPVVLQDSDIEIFGNPDVGQRRVRVTARRINARGNPISLMFGRAIGYDSVDMTATATAGLISLAGTTGMRPWAVRDRCADPPAPCPPYVYPEVGEPVTLKVGSQGIREEPYWFGPVNFPPENKGDPVTGGSAYRDNIEYGYNGLVEIGDVVRLEHGNMGGPTRQGVDYLVQQDPGAYWDTTTNQIMGSAYPDNQSPKIVTIMFYDPNIPVDSHGPITVTRLGAFFLEEMTRVDGEEAVTGRFMEGISSGRLDRNAQSRVFGVGLVE